EGSRFNQSHAAGHRSAAAPLLKFDAGLGRNGCSIARKHFNDYFQIRWISYLKQWSTGSHDARILLKNVQHLPARRRLNLGDRTDRISRALACWRKLLEFRFRLAQGAFGRGLFL